jgi:hypothetical protein
LTGYRLRQLLDGSLRCVVLSLSFSSESESQTPDYSRGATGLRPARAVNLSISTGAETGATFKNAQSRAGQLHVNRPRKIIIRPGKNLMGCRIPGTPEDGCLCHLTTGTSTSPRHSPAFADTSYAATGHCHHHTASVGVLRGVLTGCRWDGRVDSWGGT